MQRYILNNQTKTFYEGDLHHITKVMRMNSGDNVILCLEGKCHLSKIDIKDKQVTYEFIEELNNKKTLNITLIQGSLKGTKIDTTIKYATIFGAKSIIVTNFNRSIGRVKNSDFKTERYFNIAKEAAELSHREMIPAIELKESLKQIVWDQYDYILLADEEEHNMQLQNLQLEDAINKKIAVIIGPEGGIDDNERDYFKSVNAQSISLGNYIFPAEIAGISVLNILSNLNY
ncbi:MAG: RsmE family RNA methyltransferase [Acholeplasma sp.]|nr:RsmE family RNA methyltransferase [Acholeplasma sp.]